MKQYKIGYTQGVYDMFHVGHLNLINNAKKYCEHLIVGINADDLVEEYKHKRPVIGENEREYIVENIKAVDETIIAIHTLPESRGTGLGHAMLTEALKQIGNQPVFLWAFKENTRARCFYEKHGFHWDGSERVSEFDDALEVRYIRV